MTAAEFAKLIKGAKRRAGSPWWDGQCPAHDDRRGSLSFTDGDSGLVVKCHAGCALEAVTAARGLTVAQLFNGNGSDSGRQASGPRRIVATYDYTDATGALRYQVVRLEPKDFRCRQPDDQGGYRWTMDGVRRVPYRLHELAEAPRVYVPEGEKDVDNLRAAGLTASCNEGGAGKWRPEHTEAIVAAAVPELVLLPDNDQAGEDHARSVARAGLAAGLRVKIVHLPGLPPKGDVSDWLAAGHTASELEGLADAAPALTTVDATDVPAAERWTIHDGGDEWPAQPVEFVVESLLPSIGVVWWAGMPKRYKSLLAVYVMLAIACQRAEIAGRFKIRGRPRILYVGREDGLARFAERRADICAAWGVRPERGAIRFLIRQALDLCNAEDVAALRDLCRAEQITVLVLDTWTAVSPTADPLGAKDQAQLAATVVQLAQDIGGVVVVVDHSRKNRGDGPLSSVELFGPPQKWAAADHLVVLETVGDRRLEVFIESKDTESARFFLEVSPRGSGDEKFTFAGAVEDVAEARRELGNRNREAVYQAVARAGVPVMRAEILDALKAMSIDLSESTVKTHLAALVAAGRLAVSGKAKATRYAATESDTTPSRPIQPIAPADQESLYE